MTKLDRFRDSEQLSLEDLLAEARPQGNDGVGKGDRVKHILNTDFEGVVVDVNNGKAKVHVLRWLGPELPPNPVTVPTARLLVVS